MKKKFILNFCLACALFLLVNAGCKTYVQYKYGIAAPREETPGSLLSFLENHDFPSANTWVFSDSAGYCRFLQQYAFRSNILGHMIFDREGRMLDKDTAKCQWAGSDLLLALHPDSAYAVSPGISLEKLLESIVPLGTPDMALPGAEAPDFTVVVTWAKFIGKYNYRLFDLEKAVRGNQHARIRLIWLNIDMQKSWRLKPGQKLSFS